MSEKARQFRSLLLEPLECRSVLSADGLEVWQFSQSTLIFKFDTFQPAQYPHVEAESFGNGSRSGDSLGRSNDFGGVKFYKGPSTQRTSGWGSSGLGASGLGFSGVGSSMHRGRFDDASLPVEESEAQSPAPNSKPVLDAKPTLDTKTTVPTSSPSSDTRASIDPPSLMGLSQSHSAAQASVPTLIQFVSSGAERVSSSQVGNSTGSVSQARVPSSISQNTPSFNSIAQATNAVPQVNLASASSSTLSTLGSGTITFDFSSRSTIGTERSSTDGLGSQSASDFRFTRPVPVPADVVDEAFVDQASGLDSLDSLLPWLAENHQRSRMKHGFDTNQLDSSGNQNWRPETPMSVEVAFADGGMIALALNRDIAMNELEELSDDARSEHKAWIANVGIFRAFENGAVAATEYAGLTNRTTRNSVSTSSVQELSEVEGEVANSQYHPLLASTSAALGIVMLGLRRIRRRTMPLLFTARKR